MKKFLDHIRIFQNDSRLIILCGMKHKIENEYMNYSKEQSVKERLEQESSEHRFRKLFCKHYYMPLANVRDDYVTSERTKKTLMYCAKCRKIKWVRTYYDAPYIYTPGAKEFIKKNYTY